MQKRPILLRSLLIEATLYPYVTLSNTTVSVCSVCCSVLQCVGQVRGCAPMSQHRMLLCVVQCVVQFVEVCVAACCAVCCSVCCSVLCGVLLCVLQCVGHMRSMPPCLNIECCSVCCNVLQRVATCWSRKECAPMSEHRMQIL